MRLNATAVLNHLLTAEADPDLALSIFLGRSTDEVAEFEMDRFRDGVSRHDLRDLIHDRALAATGIESLAHSVQVMIADIMPLAETTDEVDLAINKTASWIVALAEGGFERIVACKHLANETGVLELNPDELDAEHRMKWETALDVYMTETEGDHVRLQLGRHQAIITVEEDATLVLIQLEGNDWAILYAFEHPNGGGGGDFDDEPEPEPDPTPECPVLLDA